MLARGGVSREGWMNANSQFCADTATRRPFAGLARRFDATERWLERESLAALLDLGLGTREVARYLRLSERDVELLRRTYRL
jgi:hypothetical protein